ncbi:MAG: retropepsin-like aspartic protease [Patescibacteria group bacterium]
MEFPYFVLPGDPSATPRPLVPVRYKYKSKETYPILTLIDSGADYSFATFKIALYLGINFKKIKPVSITGFNQSKMDCFPKEITIEIAGRDLILPVYFGGSLTQEYPCILGQDIFFDKAKITFERYKWSFGIDWKNRKS